MSDNMEAQSDVKPCPGCGKTPDVSAPISFFEDQGGWSEADGPVPVLLRPGDRKGGDPSKWPEDLRVREFPAVAEAR